ncbi:hypothetical protein [Nakamurella endophytica]|uniref:Uncharacterized protein n=1 Tax=Nakamurella endophytica TaxID=1748367 RepID=A0A917SKN0_9ACTN|nr:hypothetical protein [Nakamurella endophytica]GGL85641.1 hypothetical protein GCM10011594_01610 [Nakamurella endophytica]
MTSTPSSPRPGPGQSAAPGPAGTPTTDGRRLDRSLEQARAARELARIPVSSQVVLLAVMLAFFSGALDFTFQAAWEWWLLPLAALVVAGVLVRQRVNLRRRRLAELARPS